MSKLSNRQTSTRKNFPDEARTNRFRNKKRVNYFRDKKSVEIVFATKKCA